MTSKLSSICVYCGSGNGANPAFQQAATEFGQILGQNQIRLVYGGGNVGLMGKVADGTLSAGGHVLGVMPKHLVEKEVAHPNLTDLAIVENMHDRKMKMFEESDAFVVLPGGFGTLDEMFEILTWRQLQIHTKPLVLANLDNYWAPLLSLLDHMIAEKFAGQGHLDQIALAHSVTDILPAALNAPTNSIDVREKWQKK